VVSPHSDDAVFSLAATMTRAARTGTRVEVLTVFALDPTSNAPANGWDSRAGFETEGDAAAARRNEDRIACSIIGANATWLPFRGSGYTPERSPDEVWDSVQRVVSGADAVLVPGDPLTNPDHAWLSELLTARPLPCRRVGLYAEQPYRAKLRSQRQGPHDAEWVRSRPRPGEYRLKRKAVRAYATQLPLLGYSKRPWTLDRMLLREAVMGGEALAWLGDGGSSGS
jgi:LmbE family N-acetylglucosaminyl deacetylase